MATDEERLIVSVEARITDIEKNMKKAEALTTRSFQNMQKQVSSATKRMEADTARSTQRINQSLASTTSQIGLFGKAFAVGFVATAFVAGATKLIDANTKITNSLKTTGLAGAEQKKVYEELFAVANKNSAPVESLVELYSRVSVVQQELGVSSEQLVGLTDNVGKSLRITGSSAEEASGTLLQLAQAFGGSKIQAQEYNSLIDGALPLLKAAAAGIQQAGGSVSKLTALVKDGKISNKAFFDGIEAGTPVLDKMLDGAVQTVGQSTTNLYNALVKMGGEFENSTGGAKKLAGVIQELADALPHVNFDNLITGINGILTPAYAVTSALQKILGLLGDIGTKQGALAMAGNQDNSLATIEDQLRKNAAGPSTSEQLLETDRQRQYINGKIQELQDQGLTDLPAGQGALANYKSQLAELDKQTDDIRAKTRAAKDDVLTVPAATSLEHPHSAATPPTVLKPIDITDAKYAVAGDTKKTKSGGKGSKADPYGSEVASVKERTAALQAETAAQAGLNPLINDYDYASTRAATAAELFAKAQKGGTAAGKELSSVQQLLKGDFTGLSSEAAAQAQAMLDLADGYAGAKKQAGQLAASQDKMRQSAEEWTSVSKDASEGFVKDLIAGKSAAEALTNALDKIVDRLLDSAFDNLFSMLLTPATGGGTGLLGGLFSLFSAKGNVFSAGEAVPFAKGGAFTNSVVGSPTAFNMGVMGEAGPEAIMPLTRDGSGRLGVANHGGSGKLEHTATFHTTIEVKGTGDAELLEQTRVIAAAQTKQQIDQFNSGLPDRINQVNRNPSKR